ncbi:phosphomannomutase/phosphoglucomutase [Patescibacteria group bacterium]|nr:phosphomannomutase/phosphoglucomutase [Patescibacteria group bacterium]
MAKINQAIFHTYDIRGIYPKEINGRSAYLIARAFALFTQAPEIPIAYDMRRSSPALLRNILKGLKESGVEAIDIGLMPTPVLNFVVAEKQFKAGIIITASHNPKEYNGIKLIGPKAVQYDSQTGIEMIKKFALKGKFKNGRGRIIKKDYLALYLKKIKKHTTGIKKLKIVVDFGNGLGSISALPLYKELPIKIISLYPEPDGAYPNHPANPAEEENLADLKKEIIKKKADLGIAFDGDADRAFFIDEKGKTARADHLMAALSLYELKKRPKAKIYFDLRFSKIVPDIISKFKGKPVVSRVGNPFYKEKLILEGGAFAAEMAGHFMFADFYGIDDGLFATLKVMKLICDENKPLSAILEPFQKGYFQSGEINIKTEKADKIINILKKEYSKAKINYLDGITIETPVFWFNLRPSNTEPLIRLNAEAKDKKILDREVKKIITLIKKNK